MRVESHGGGIASRFQTAFAITVVILGSLCIIRSWDIPTVKAVTMELSHNAGYLDFNVDNHATLPFCIKYDGVQQSDEVGGWKDDTFFFFDQSKYVHSGADGDIATGREYPSITGPVEFDTTASDTPLSFLEDGMVDKSSGSFTKIKDINGQANDIRVFQTAWSKQGEDWGIIQWTICNLFEEDLTEVRFGLRIHTCIDGDNADDRAFWDPTDKVYYIRDSGSATYFGFASADPGVPINMYCDRAINDLYTDRDIYDAAIASPYVSGHYNDLGCVVGWTDDEVLNNGLNLTANESITRPLTMAVGTSYTDLLTAINNARRFYLQRALMITEIRDEGTPRVEIYNVANVSQDLTNVRLSVNGGGTFLLDGSWDVNPLPAKDYAVWTLSGSDEFDGTEGDTIGLYNLSSGIKCDEVAFGQEGTAPDPIEDGFMGSISRTRITDWVHSLHGMTFGAHNNENESIEKSPDVIINEVMFNPLAPEYAFIELMYIGEGSIDLKGFSIVTDDIMCLPESYVLDPNDPYLLIFRNDAPQLFDNGNLSISADNVYLYDDENNLHDMVGWNTAHQINRTISRVPDGQGTYQGYDNITSEAAGWLFNQFPTIPLVNIGPAGQFEYGDPGDEVWYNLTITSKMGTGMIFDIYNLSLEGWLVEIFFDFMGTKISDTDGDEIPDVFIGAFSSVSISIKVTIPSSGITGDYGDTLITVKANSDPAISHYVTLQTRFYPYLLPGKSITPLQININGTGYDEVATITLNITGSGFGIPVTKPQDVVFVVDRSNSLIPSEIEVAKDAITEYVENMSTPDRGAVVYFDQEVVLMSSLTSNYGKLKKDISEIPGPGDLTYMGEALLIALQELISHGNDAHHQVIILLTDGGWNGELDPVTVAYWARENYTYIYTIGLGGGGEKVLREIANITGAEYYYAETAEDLRGIYYNISTIIDKTAGRDEDTTDSIPMVRDVLPPWIDYIPGSFSIAPDYVYVNESGYTILEWNMSRMLIGEVWEVTFDITSSMAGYLEANNYTASRISYINWADLQIEKLFPKTMISVIEPPPPPPPDPLPPELFIEVVDDSGNPNGTGDNIYLYWIPQSTVGIAYYLIYRSEDQITFNFSKPWINTSQHFDNGIISLRTTWNDTDAAKPGELNYHQQRYYIIRAVNTLGFISGTSRTVGKWTKQFCEGLNTFSLPLEPLQIHDADFYKTDMGATYIRWMDPVTHVWRKYGDGSLDNTQIEVGQGYEVKFTSQTDYTFTGLPGAMIQHEDNPLFAGFNWSSDARSLTAMVDDYDVVIFVTLNWARPEGMSEGIDEYRVYHSPTRDGFWGTLGENYFLNSIKTVGTETVTYGFSPQPEIELYYLVVPVLSSGEIGTSTYTIGIWIVTYDAGYDTLALPLKLDTTHSADWYCDAIEYTWGINYFDVNDQQWMWHKTIMPEGIYDTDIVMAEGYQISTTASTRYSFIGV